MKLAFMTVGRLREPFHHPESRGFVERVPAIYQAADGSDGLVARSDRDMQTLQHGWGPVRHPKCYGGGADSNRLPSTLSLWEDLESVAAFAYTGAHGEALARRRDWFDPHETPTYVAYWVDDGVERLDWQEAADRLDHLHDHGPTPYAFNFKQPFDGDGNPVSLDRERVRAKAGELGHDLRA